MSWIPRARIIERRVNQLSAEASSLGAHQQGMVLIPLFIALLPIIGMVVLIVECSLLELGTAVQCVFHTGSPFDAQYSGDIGQWICGTPADPVFVDQRLSIVAGVFAYTSPVWILAIAGAVSRWILRREAERIQRIMDEPLAPSDDWR
jgi:hypothetical protein